MQAVTNFYQAETNESNTYEIFAEHLDNLYFEGYAEQLAIEHPERFDFELIQFLHNNF